MDTSTINQIISTTGLIVGPVITIFITYFLVNKLIKRKSKIQNEIDYIKQILFLYTVIDKYKQFVKTTNKTSQYNKIREEAEKELGYSPLKEIIPSKLKPRLSELGVMSEKIGKTIKIIET